MADGHERVDRDQLREDLLELAEVIRKLDERDELLHAAPELIKIFGNLRSQLFEFEVRHTANFFRTEGELPEIAEAQRIVHEAVQRLEEEDEEWWRRFSTEDDEEDIGGF
jgi:hypothetical protein